MRITVVTVTYNSASTLGDALDSVRAQSHPDVEHIVIDGGSQDATAEVVSRHGPHVAQFVSERDDGIYDAMNKGLAAATGDLVGFLNADDTFAGPQALARLAAGIGDRDAVYADVAYVSANDTDRIVRLWRSGAYRRDRLAWGWMPPHPTFYLRRSRMAAVGAFDTRLRIAADYDFMMRCLGPFGMSAAYVPEVAVHMRLGGVSNRSLTAMVRKSREDLYAMHRNAIGGPATLVCKNLRKLPQFLARPSSVLT